MVNMGVGHFPCAVVFKLLQHMWLLVHLGTLRGGLLWQAQGTHTDYSNCFTPRDELIALLCCGLLWSQNPLDLMYNPLNPLGMIGWGAHALCADWMMT